MVLHQDMPLDDDGNELANALDYLISDIDHEQPQYSNHCKHFRCQKGSLFCRKHKYPILRIIASVLVLFGSCGVFIGMGCYALLVLKPAPIIDISYNAFTIVNHKASEYYDALSFAVKYNTTGSFRVRRSIRDTHSPNGNGPSASLDRKKKSTVESSPAMEAYRQSHIQWKMEVIFLARGEDDKNILKKEHIKYIHEIEQKIRHHKDYPNFCYRDLNMITKDPEVRANNECAPLNSLLTYFYPSQDSAGVLYYDGLGSNMADVNSAINMSMTHSGFYYYVDEKANKASRKSSLLRTEVFFGSPLKGVVTKPLCMMLS